MKAFTISVAIALTCLAAQAQSGEDKPTQATALSEAAQVVLQALEAGAGTTLQVDERELAVWASAPAFRYRIATNDGHTALGGTQAFDQAWKSSKGIQGPASLLASSLASDKGYLATEVVIALGDMAAVTHPHQLHGDTDDSAQLTYYEGRALEVVHAWRLFAMLQDRMPKQAHYTSEGYVMAFAKALASIDEDDLATARNASERSLVALEELKVSYTKGATTWAVPGLTVRESGQQPSLQVSLVTSGNSVRFDDSLVDIKN